MRRSLLKQTWPNFKHNFGTAHQELRDTNTTVDELGFSSTNAIAAQIIDQLRAEVPVETKPEPQVFTTTPSPLSDNLPTANTVQAVFDTAITSLMASMMVNMETMRARLEESDAELRDGNGQFGSRQRNHQHSTSTDVAENVAEDIDAAQLEVNARHTEADANATPTEIARPWEETARHAEKAIRKQLPYPT